MLNPDPKSTLDPQPKSGPKPGTDAQLKSDSRPNPNSEPKLSQKIAELDQAVDWFYSEDFDLDQALEKYRAANALADSIEHDLEALKNQVEVLADFTKS